MVASDSDSDSELACASAFNDDFAFDFADTAPVMEREVKKQSEDSRRRINLEEKIRKLAEKQVFSENESEGQEISEDEPAKRKHASKEGEHETSLPEDALTDEEEEEKKKAYFDDAAIGDSTFIQSFHDLNLSRALMKGLNTLGFVKPTRIQAAAVPIALQGRDICGGAVTGSGKTAAFMIPIVERLLHRPKFSSLTRVLVILPTRELAVQCAEVAGKMTQFTDIQMTLVTGGMPMKPQEAELRKRPDVIIATPGRLIDHLTNSPSFSLEHVEILVLDEADRMLEDGFKDELDEIIRHCPKSRQTMLFSATMTDTIDDLIRLSLNKPVRLFVDSQQRAAMRLTQEFVRIRETQETNRATIVLALCKRSFKSHCIVFFPTKELVHRMRVIFGLAGLSASELHGNLSQSERTEALENFRNGAVDFLLATDLAARGLDIQGVQTVINYSMPATYKQYLHRVGRTARAGRAGRSITLAGEADRKILKLVIKNAKASNDEPVKHRIVPAAVIQSYKERIGKMAEDIETLLREEKEARLLKRAEMEADRAQNIMEHSEEIKSRPAKSWFQTQKDKRHSKERSLEVSGPKTLTMAKRRKRQLGDEEVRITMKKGKGAFGKRRMNADDDNDNGDEIGHVKRVVKAGKYGKKEQKKKNGRKSR